MANQIAAIQNYTNVLDAVYQKASVSGCLTSGGRMVQAGTNAKEIKIPKIVVTGLGDYTRNVGYKTGTITFDYETKTFNYDRGIKLLADVMDVEEAGVLDCFVAAGSELMRTQVAPEADAFTFAEIASHEGVDKESTSYADAEAPDLLKDLRAVTNDMDELEVTESGRILFITPTLKGMLDDYSLLNPNLSKHVLTRFSRIIEVPQRRFYSKIDLLSGDAEQFGFAKATDGKNINWLICEKSAVIKYDKHVASRIFSPDELENLDSYMRKYRKYGIVELLDNKLDGVRVSVAV